MAKPRVWPEIMTVSELADYLNYEPRTISDLAKQGKIPGAAKIGGEWRFMRRIIDGMFETPSDTAERFLNLVVVGKKRKHASRGLR